MVRCSRYAEEAYMQENESPIAPQKTVHARITEEILAVIAAGLRNSKCPGTAAVCVEAVQ
jgi:hypothetical protein